MENINLPEDNNNIGKLFKVMTLKSTILKILIEILKPYIKEMNIMFTPEYIKISTLDISKSSVTYVKLYANKFESYYCKEPIIIGVDTTTFFKAIKSTNRRETISLSMDEGNTDKLCIELADLFQGKVKSYNLPLLSLEEKMVHIKDMEFQYIINMPSTQFQQIIKDIHLLDGKTVEIKSIGMLIMY